MKEKSEEHEVSIVDGARTLRRGLGSGLEEPAQTSSWGDGGAGRW